MGACLCTKHTDEIHIDVTDKFDKTFEDIVDIVDEKHIKYMEHYDTTHETIFWGIGVENETYLMQTDLKPVASFRHLKKKRERYSVDYFKSFKVANVLIQDVNTFDALTYPVYINSHTFQSTDDKQEHRTHYDVGTTPNKAFTESLHDVLLRESKYYRTVYNGSLVFDGDSIEFITQDFYCATVASCVAELTAQKQRFLAEIRPYFQRWHNRDICFPDHNYGFVSFLTTKNQNLGLCNNGTLHMNLTLPTAICNGVIKDKAAFIQDHLRVVPFIQVVEPLLVACYGTPDVFSLVSNSYAVGSQRVALSRYISLQTFDADAPVNGKQLLMDRPADPTFWQNAMHHPYQLNDKIGYDINFNKFKNHGIELRFFDWFPEEYLEDVLHFFVLLAQHAMHAMPIKSITANKAKYSSIVQRCVLEGFACVLSSEDCELILGDLQLSPLNLQSHTAYSLLNLISQQLHELHRDGPIVQLMSPNRDAPKIVNYNWIAYQKLHYDLFGKPELIIRLEANASETRTPIVPRDIHALLTHFRVLVETSQTRCYSDENYRSCGATIVPKDYWVTSKHSYVLGIKHPAGKASKTQTLLHFAHCFKGQRSSRETLDSLSPAAFLDYEYMVDSAGKRVISFCGQSGKIGAYLALMAYYKNYYHATRVIPEFNEAVYNSMLYSYTARNKPAVLLIGFGTVGKSCKAVLDHFCIPCTIVTSKTAVSKKVILGHDILLHAIRLDESQLDQKPFLEKSDLVSGHLSVICDISCDLGHPLNTLPIYDAFTTKEKPVVRMEYGTNKINVIAINCLPALEPVLSSDQFSAQLVTMLPDVLHFKRSYSISSNALAFYRAWQAYEKARLL